MARNLSVGDVRQPEQGVHAGVKLLARYAAMVEKTMLLLAKPRLVRTARHDCCRCGGPVRYASRIRHRRESYSKPIALP